MKDRVLLLCYGNPGRLDDGLGPALAQAVEAVSPPGTCIQVDYQLTVDDAPRVAEHEVVIFVDATVSGRAPFTFEAVTAESGLSFSSHALSPGQVLALARSLFSARTEAFALAIRGYRFEAFGETLSGVARRNLRAAVAFLLPLLEAERGEEPRAGAAFRARVEAGGRPAAGGVLEAVHTRIGESRYGRPEISHPVCR